MGLPLVLLERRRIGGFNPRAILAGSTALAWFDPSDLPTLFQDAAGTTPVTAPAQPVGLVLDKSQGLVLGPELVTNGDFSNGTTGWTTTSWVISNGSASITNANDSITQNLSLAAGRTYRVSYTLSGFSGTGAFRPRFFGGTTVTGTNVSANGTYVEYMVAVSGNNQFAMTNTTATCSGTIDNVSVRELPGFHATQSTAANRPTYGVVPSRGRVNLLQQTEVFTNAYWLTQGGSWSAVDGNGFQTFTEDNALSQHRLFRDGLSFTSGQAYTLSARVSYGTRQWVFLAMFDGTATVHGWFDLLNGVRGSVSAGATSTMTLVSAGVYDITLTRTAAGTTTSGNVQIGTQVADNQTANWTANGSSFRVSRYQVEASSTASAYQRVVSQFEVTDPVGFPSYPLHYLFFGGELDPRWLQTSTITPNADKVQVFAGVRKLSDALDATVAEFSTGTNTGTFDLMVPAAISATYRFRSRGTATGSAISGTTFAAPITNILTGIGDISGDLATLRVNGTQAAQSTTDQGTGNYLAYPLFIGRRGGTSFAFNGQLYGLIVRFSTANLDASLINQTERWLAQKTGVTI